MVSNCYRLNQLLLLIALLSVAIRAQSSGTGQQPEGWENNGYLVHQSIEIGYRVADVTGSQPMYDTLVNLRSGPRLLDQSLSMQSQNHNGLLFDNLFVNSFGWGGDPNNGLRARLDKALWYDFRANFRRDQTDFDYNLLANPLNPSNSSPSFPVLSSPHSFATRRRMSDFDLTLLPQAVVAFRLGYSRNNMTGPSFSSVHEGTDALLYQGWNTTLNSYRFGADVKLARRTVVSYDQFLDYYKGDTSWNLAPFAQALLPGTPGTVELGLPFATGNKTPCAINPPATSLIDSTGTLTNIACNAYLNYNRSDRIRTYTPTERLSLHSSYFQRLELSASYAYSAADMNTQFNELFNGLSQRSRLRQEIFAGPGHARQISNVADFSVTAHLTKHLRLVDTFRFWAYRTPESFDSTDTQWIVPGSGSCAPPSCSLLTSISGITPTATNALDQRSFNQSWKRNQVDLVWDASKHWGGRIGFRYGDRDFHQVLDFTTGDQERVVTHEYTPLLAVWAKPTANLRFNFDWEHTNNDATIVRIGPRKETRYRVQTNYVPRPWAILTGSINIWEASNGDALINFKGHNRNYGFTAALAHGERLNFDFAYNYNDYKQNALICFNDSDTSLTVVANAGSCVNDIDNNPLLTVGSYTNGTHYGMGSVLFKATARVTAQVGYGITSVGGHTPQFNSLQPAGSLQYNYHQPLANVAVDIGHNLTAKAGWNYYQYGEKSFVGPTAPRYFHANNATFSLKWAF
jgi:hypothetical protein